MEVLYKKVTGLDQLKTQFFANVSHELRTPLALVLGPTRKLLASADLTEEQRRDLQVIERNARDVLKQVNDLLDISKIEAGKMEARHAEVDLARLVRLTAGHFESLARERQIVFSVEAPPTLLAQLDAEKIQRVLSNLLSNAFKFVPEGGTIRSSLRSGDGAAILTVQDSGPGVRPELREVIFERFRQGDGGSTRRFGGTGLGLAITKELVELHGGTIRVGDGAQGGALFTVELPLAACAGSELHAPPAALEGGDDEHAVQLLAEVRAERDRRAGQVADDAGEAAPAGADAAEQPPLVLVIEDNPEMNRFVAESLAGDYRVATAFDGREGLEKALALRPDLVLSDVMMPRMSGDQLLRELRARSEMDAVPVALLTAKADDELRVALLREGAQDYLMKPFSTEELHARVGNLVVMKRARQLLQDELASREKDLAALAGELVGRKHELQSALEALRDSEARERAARSVAEAASQAKDEFLATLSHELRTPLQALLGWAPMIREGKLDPATSRLALETIERNARLLAQLVKDILDVSRIITGRLRPEVRPVDLVPLIEAVIDSAGPAAEAKRIRVRRELDPSAARVAGDPYRLQQVIWNLVSNAIKFTPEEGSVEVRLERLDAHVEISVRDTGAGISPEFLPHVFDRFRQHDSSSTRGYGGLGLGLAIVRHLVELDGGAVHAASPGVGRGATFTVRLPAGEIRAGDEADAGLPRASVAGVGRESWESRPASVRGGPEDSATFQGLEVLVVEDEADVRELLAAMLRMVGARVTAVGSCAEALAALDRRWPDVLVSDIGMPGEDGYALIRKVRAREAERGGRIPAAAISGFAREEDRRRALQAGYQMYLAKPVDPTELVGLVAMLTGKPQPWATGS